MSVRGGMKIFAGLSIGEHTAHCNLVHSKGFGSLKLFGFHV